MKIEFSQKYADEIERMCELLRNLEKNEEDIGNIEIIYLELDKFVHKSIDAKILSKINDISSFISKSIEDLEKTAKAKGYDKETTYIDPMLKPLVLNVQKAYEIIGKFNMTPKKNSSGPQPNNVA